MHMLASPSTHPVFIRPFSSQQISRQELPPLPANGDFVIRTIDTPDCRARASHLLERRYRWRGYGNVGLPKENQLHRCTLGAFGPQQVLGTITVNLDGPEGLNCEALFSAEVSELRAAGARVCEFTRLAVEVQGRSSNMVLTALFHAAYTLDHQVRGCDTLLVEVNPRHVRYYEKSFGAETLASERMHSGVNAPAVLLTLCLASVARLAERAGAAVAGTWREPDMLPRSSWVPTAQGAAVACA